jgi:hypothetical protein
MMWRKRCACRSHRLSPSRPDYRNPEEKLFVTSSNNGHRGDAEVIPALDTEQSSPVRPVETLGSSLRARMKCLSAVGDKPTMLAIDCREAWRASPTRGDVCEKPRKTTFSHPTPVQYRARWSSASCYGQWCYNSPAAAITGITVRPSELHRNSSSQPCRGGGRSPSNEYKSRRR